ncbi:MAG: F0F1 ATP synthase subunit B [Alphaproteobacteria bacterium]|jgi:F-type H+-transporting ATPase subunit b|nr:ATP synthase F0 subunit B [Rhodobiaceae bacterium]MBO6544642.1 F0F1 ATP synthase subunit B [Alphaproteobacteria bacterium]MBO6627943.1 F0F1 ATP synthase subunit B [Alphaproteobacteria bacterium]MDF1625513.1 F0F1 ATP synthase subunit B [Parvibaculaceae bacterium]|tara:strand:- start:61 stop:546 length:486 start_codon:yes stop_codon:yes gene_type:complete
MLQDATFWVLISFLIFVGLVVYYKVPGMIAAALDKRAADIAHELDEARKLREEAQQVLASYQRKQRDAEKEAQAIVEQAREEAERLAVETKDNLAAHVERRTKLAEDKIAQAEAQALQEVRAVAADVAVAAARTIIEQKLDGARATQLLDKSIAEVKAKLH